MGPHLLIVVSIGIALIAGLITKYVLDKNNSQLEITWIEFVIVVFVISLITAPGSVFLGYRLAKQNQLTFHEYWNGWELQAVKSEVKCYRDGPCYWEYDCDPYQVPYQCNCDKNGNCQTCYRTEWHDCPYVQNEYNYTVKTTIGDMTIDTHRFPEHPQANRWRRGRRIPDHIIGRAGVGDHPFWLKAKERLEKNLPGPVVKRMNYENYLYASDQTILKNYSSEIAKYQEMNLLPPVQSKVHDFYLSNKVLFVGYTAGNSAQIWQSTLNNLNAAAGMELQGDVHLVITQDKTINQSPDSYSLSLKAYWQNPEIFERDAFSKNGIGIILGTTDGKTVAWAKAFTGMPVGNTEMTAALETRLKKAELKPETIIGDIFGELESGSVKTIHGKGVIEDVIFGLSNPGTKFKRISMKAEDADDEGGGFTYLSSQIRPSAWQSVLVVLTAVIISCLGWVAAAYIGQRSNNKQRW